VVGSDHTAQCRIVKFRSDLEAVVSYESVLYTVNFPLHSAQYGVGSKLRSLHKTKDRQGNVFIPDGFSHYNHMLEPGLRTLMFAEF
jgi:hypothetical protein